jgi:rfaE bifunctional protein nucleotidyltransferase chain/domain
VSTARKVQSLEAVAAAVESARRAGKTVALANGVFDLLHVGHVRYLEGARALADVLVVAVNDDASARALKGPGRPQVPATERAELVAALGCTDHVLLFSEPDVRGVLRRLRPDVQVKGTDYTAQSVPERDELAAWGGRVAIAGDPKEHSTTELLEKLRSR